MDLFKRIKPHYLIMSVHKKTLIITVIDPEKTRKKS